jgi:hypothetical protein
MPNYGKAEKGDFEPRQLPVTGLIPNPDYIAPLIAVAGIVYRRCNATSVPLGAKRV